jgi:peptidoglycan/xylan/chitin deacetylase (PgdA/CDA1 family)
MFGTARLRHYAKSLRNYMRRNTLILLYHRVAKVPTDPHLLCVTPDNFSQQMEVLRKNWNLISLSELTKGLRDQKLPRRSVLVTFDDGYADNLHNAKPVLEWYKIPAVVFVISGSVGVEHGFWWDELEKLLLRPGTLPEELTIRLDAAETRWQLGQSATAYSEEDYRMHATWYFGKKVPTDRHALYVDLYKTIRRLTPDRQHEMLELLRIWSGYKASKSDVPMTVAELRELCRGNLVEVGAHTVSHPILSTLPSNRQRREISDSRKSLQQILDQRIAGFAYPYGGDGDYNRETMGLVREAGFELAFSTASGLIQRNTETFRLPRNWVRNWPRDQFAAHLQRWFYD